MSWSETVELIRSDAERRGGGASNGQVVRILLAGVQMRYQVVVRLLQYARQHHKRSPLHVGLVLLHRRLTVKYGFEIPVGVRIGPGLMLRHLGPIVVHQETVLGRNVNLNTGVVIGRAFRGSRAGVPVIGDNVYVGPGAKVIGAIVVGDDVVIGANAVVVDDVPAGSVVAGVPARIVSTLGADGYIENRV